MKPPRLSAAAIEYLRRLGNPYAKEQISDDSDAEFRALSAEERAYVRELGNQYAPLSIALRDTAGYSASAKHAEGHPGTISKADFESECRRMFKPYIPELEKGRLRPHHLAFIQRNRLRAPHERYALVRQLSKYDLGSTAGLQAQFNRERDPFTEQKLKGLEQAAFGQE